MKTAALQTSLRFCTFTQRKRTKQPFNYLRIFATLERDGSVLFFPTDPCH